MTEPHDATVANWYRAAAQEEPPAELDAAVLAAAHRAVAAGPQALGRARRKLWLMPMAAAAVLVLSVTILRLTPTSEVLPERAPSAAPAAPAQLAAEAVQAAPEAQEAQPGPAASAAPPRKLAKARAPAEAPQVAPLRRSLPEGAAKREEAEAVQGYAARTVPQASSALPGGAAPPPAMFAPPPRPAAPPAAPEPAAVRGEMKLAPADKGALALGTSAATAPSANQSAEAQLAFEDRASRPAPVLAAPRADSASPSPAPQGASLRAKRAQADRLAEAGRPSPTDPESWIRELLRLQAEAPEPEFLRALAAFRVAYPTHTLPPPLQAAVVRLERQGPSPFPAAP